MTRLDPSVDDRLTQLEYQVAFQDDIIETLNTTVIFQEKQLQRLGEQIARLSVKLSSMAELIPETSQNRPDDDVPPHY